MRAMTAARLVLEDGTVYDGESFGSSKDSIGEVVFNTSLAGYQEIATDPSYRFQIVVMTYPHMGNYGVEDQFEQSAGPQVSGFVVREVSVARSLPTGTRTLTSYFEEHGIAGIAEIDTRSLTRKIRSAGAMRGMITIDGSKTVENIVDELLKSPSMTGLDLVERVSIETPMQISATNSEAPRIAVYDFGVKRDILRRLTAAGCAITVYPARTPADTLLREKFDGVVLSNGPGDPEPVTYAQENIRALIGKVPMLGICLGHQLLGLALGGRTYKLKFGHRGGNHPVKDLRTGRIEITAQNHGFAVDPDSLDSNAVEHTHINLNDQTLEGFRHKSEPIVAVQYHPEAAPGPHDSFYVFQDFFEQIKQKS